MESEILEKKISLELSEEKSFLLNSLKYVETYNQRLSSVMGEYNNIFIKPFGLEDEFQINQDDIPFIDVSRVQRKIIEYKLKEGNNILEQSVKKRKSIEDSLYDISRDNEGVLRFLPKFPDKEHNKKVDEMIDLIGKGINIEFLYKRPIDNLFKLTTFPFISGGLFYFVAYGAMKLSQIPNKNLVDALILGAGLSGFYSGIDFCLRITPKNEDLPWEDAKYLDDKIRELF